MSINSQLIAEIAQAYENDKTLTVKAVADKFSTDETFARAALKLSGVTLRRGGNAAGNPEALAKAREVRSRKAAIARIYEALATLTPDEAREIITSIEAESIT